MIYNVLDSLVMAYKDDGVLAPLKALMRLAGISMVHRQVACSYACNPEWLAAEMGSFFICMCLPSTEDTTNDEEDEADTGSSTGTAAYKTCQLGMAIETFLGPTATGFQRLMANSLKHAMASPSFADNLSPKLTRSLETLHSIQQDYPQALPTKTAFDLHYTVLRATVLRDLYLQVTTNKINSEWSETFLRLLVNMGLLKCEGPFLDFMTRVLDTPELLSKYTDFTTMHRLSYGVGFNRPMDINLETML